MSDIPLSYGIQDDIAEARANGALAWSGPLLPVIQLSTGDGTRAAAARVTGTLETPVDASGTLHRVRLEFGAIAEGEATIRVEPTTIELTRLEIEWEHNARLVSLWFGAAEDPRSSDGTEPYPAWSAEGYCIPCGESGPTKSYFRAWDPGIACFPLGSFGPALGSPYSAAFPRPLYAAALGTAGAWVAVGPGTVPDAALLLRTRAPHAGLEWRYREDLRNGTAGVRVWDAPLRIVSAPTALEAFGRLYDTFPPTEPKSPHHGRRLWGTWGEFRRGVFDLAAFERAFASPLAPDLVLVDDGWETNSSSGVVHRDRFPDFEHDVASLQSSGFDVGLWQAVGWIADPEAHGLTANDLLCSGDVPVRSSWSLDPFASKSYCLDPSSEGARRFVAEKIRRTMETFRPTLLKLDFAYGYPGPDTAIPRDPALRGERLAMALLELYVQAARAVDPKVTIIYYGVHPLLHHVTDLITIDDLGDAGGSAEYERLGHSQRSIWATLAARRGVAISASSGYYWDAFPAILLDSLVLGVPGGVLGTTDAAGRSANAYTLARWHAVRKYSRRTNGFQPLWLDAEPGGFHAEPEVRSWARVELLGGRTARTAVVLRPPRVDRQWPATGAGRSSEERTTHTTLPAVAYRGAWGIVSQTDQDVLEAQRIAIIPFTVGSIRIARDAGSMSVIRTDGLDVLPNGSSARLGPDAIEITIDDPAALDVLEAIVIDSERPR